MKANKKIYIIIIFIFVCNIIVLPNNVNAIVNTDSNGTQPLDCELFYKINENWQKMTNNQTIECEVNEWINICFEETIQTAYFMYCNGSDMQDESAAYFAFDAGKAGEGVEKSYTVEHEKDLYMKFTGKSKVDDNYNKYTQVTFEALKAGERNISSICLSW